jgi:2-oxo-3-hexenedioate decarboxylase
VADAVAAEAVHVSLLLGRPRQISADRTIWLAALADFSIELNGPRGIARSGRGRDALGSPLAALRFLAAELARNGTAPPLAAGEIVTTGTLTEAMPVKPGEVWTTTLHAIDLPGLRLRFE